MLFGSSSENMHDPFLTKMLPDKALHRMVIPLRSIAAEEIGRSPRRTSRLRGYRGVHFVRALCLGAKRASEQGTSPAGSAVKSAACRPLLR
jgi:hypothetical protein